MRALKRLVALGLVGLAACLLLVAYASKSIQGAAGPVREELCEGLPAVLEPAPERPDPYLAMLDRLLQRELTLRQITFDETDFQEEP